MQRFGYGRGCRAPPQPWSGECSTTVPGTVRRPLEGPQRQAGRDPSRLSLHPKLVTLVFVATFTESPKVRQVLPAALALRGDVVHFPKVVLGDPGRGRRMDVSVVEVPPGLLAVIPTAGTHAAVPCQNEQ